MDKYDLLECADEFLNEKESDRITWINTGKKPKKPPLSKMHGVWVGKQLKPRLLGGYKETGHVHVMRHPPKASNDAVSKAALAYSKKNSKRWRKKKHLTRYKEFHMHKDEWGKFTKKHGIKPDAKHIHMRNYPKILGFGKGLKHVQSEDRMDKYDLLEFAHEFLLEIQ